MWSFAIHRAIRKVVEDVGDPLMEHILSRVHQAHPGVWNDYAIRAAVQDLVQAEVLRMREDLVDHDWAYRKGAKW